MNRDDHRAVEEALGVSLGLKPTEPTCDRTDVRSAHVPSPPGTVACRILRVGPAVRRIPLRHISPTRVEASYAAPQRNGPSKQRSPNLTRFGRLNFGWFVEAMTDTRISQCPKTRPQDCAIPLIGAYYWVPSPSDEGHSWAILTCHDAGLDPDAGHPELWIWVLARLAAARGQDAGRFQRLLGDHCYGLPRGRVTRSGNSFLINHGRDSPLDDWQELVIRRFNLAGRHFKAALDDHERMLPEHTRAVSEVLGIPPMPRVRSPRT